MALGDPLPIEREFFERRGVNARPEDLIGTDDRDLQEVLWDFTFEVAGKDVARAMSIDTTWHLPRDATVNGQGVLARVPGGASASIPPGPHCV